MRHVLKLILSLVIAFSFALPAKASEYMDMDISLGRKVVARILCKEEGEVNYVSRVRENVYLFSVFYANKEARFFVGVYTDMIRVQGKDFQTTTRTIPYVFDETAKCGIVDYSIPDCPSTEQLVSCSEKTIEEQLDEKFWDRPIPDLLDEDLRKALEADRAEQEANGEQGAEEVQGEQPAQQ